MKKFLFDFFPVLLFFLVFKLYPGVTDAESQVCLFGFCISGGTDGAIYAATATAILASFLQLSIQWLQHRKLENMHLITLGILVVFGGATLILQDEVFIKWKPTVVNWVLALIFLGSQFVGNKKSIIRQIMEKSITLNDEQVWFRLNMVWVGFFIATGLLNLYVAFNFSTETWVNFKLFGIMGLTVVFGVAQALYLARYIQEEEEENNATEEQS